MIQLLSRLTHNCRTLHTTQYTLLGKTNCGWSHGQYGLCIPVEQLTFKVIEVTVQFFLTAGGINIGANLDIYVIVGSV